MVNDFNGDGRSDIAANYSSYLYIGEFAAPETIRNRYYESAGVGSSMVAGDFNHDGAPDLASVEGGGVTIYLNTGAVSTSLASSANPSKVGQAVTFQSAISPTLRGVIGTPTGTVTFKDGGTILGTGKIQVGGIASFSTSTLAKGSHSITATYSGDGNFIPKSSPVLTQVVQ